MLMCTATHTSSPWHNFVSDTEHWVVDGTGATPCFNNGGIYALGVFSLTNNNFPYLASLVANGAKSIFTTTAEATFLGTPLSSKQICTLQTVNHGTEGSLQVTPLKELPFWCEFPTLLIQIKRGVTVFICLFNMQITKLIFALFGCYVLLF